MKRKRLFPVLLLAMAGSRAAGQPSDSAQAPLPPAVATSRATNGTAAEIRGAQYMTRMLLDQASGTSTNVTALSRAPQPVLVVPTARMEIETFAQLTEDMNIMCRVVDRLLASAGLQLHGWAPLAPPDQRRATRGVYLPGFGAVLLVDVDFPLVAPPEDTPEPNVQDETDALWSEIRQQLRGQPVLTDAGRDADSGPPYDDLKVESLKRTLLAALKHASNIRGLNPTDHIVAVAVNAPYPGLPLNQVFATTYSLYGMEPSPAEPSSPQFLVLRATKAQVDVYAAGTVTPEQFREEAGVISYDLSMTDSEAPPSR